MYIYIHIYTCMSTDLLHSHYRIYQRFSSCLVHQEHIVRQEDIPLVSNFGASFSLQPFNFFEGNTVSNPPSEL